MFLCTAVALGRFAAHRGVYTNTSLTLTLTLTPTLTHTNTHEHTSCIFPPPPSSDLLKRCRNSNQWPSSEGRGSLIINFGCQGSSAYFLRPTALCFCSIRDDTCFSASALIRSPPFFLWQRLHQSTVSREPQRWEEGPTHNCRQQNKGVCWSKKGLCIKENVCLITIFDIVFSNYNAETSQWFGEHTDEMYPPLHPLH